MTEKAILDISHGDSPGFNVALEIEGKRRCTGKLPPVEEIHQLYEQWKNCYIGLEKALRGKCTSSQAGNSQDLVKECNSHANNFLAQFKEWLESKKFEPVRTTLAVEQPSRLILQTQEDTLKRLPWNKWDLLDDPKHLHYLANTEIALSALGYQNPSSSSNVERMRILAILGNSEGINVDADRELLDQLVTPYAEIDFRPQPRRTDINSQLWNENWTILFFSGHSSSQNDSGRIFINQKESLSIEDLKYGLGNSVRRGLQLAIFNSCDGLKLAEDLAELHIPQTIVMREPVPDTVAQAFLKHFLQEFLKGETLYLSVKKARSRLHGDGWDEKIPGCTWLPVIWQNPYAPTINPPKRLTSPRSAFEEGRAYFEKKDYKKAFYWFSEAAKQGDARGMNNLGVLYLNYSDKLGIEKDLKSAFNWFHKAADAGNADGQYNTGVSYENGRVVEKNSEQAFFYYFKAAEQGHEKAQRKLLEQGTQYERENPPKAIEWYERLANQGNVEAQYRLGKMYLEGGTKEDNKQAFDWFKKAAEKDHPKAHYQLGNMYYDGKGIEEPDHEEAFSCFMQAAKHELAEGQNGVGFMYLYGYGNERNYSQAFDYLCKAVDKGHAGAQVNLGQMYLNGWGVEQNDKEALKYFKKAAQKGHAEGEFLLGSMYQQGRGVSQNFEEARRLYFSAAKCGSAKAQNNLGFMYQNGQGGLNYDDKEAVYWYRMAANQGNAYGQYNLALMYENGRGLPLDWMKAHEWYRKAAEQFEKQETLAPHLLAYMYEQGKGVTQDYCKAAEWYRKAIDQGYPNLENKLQEVSKKCTKSFLENPILDFQKELDSEKEIDLMLDKVEKLRERAKEMSFKSKKLK